MNDSPQERRWDAIREGKVIVQPDEIIRLERHNQTLRDAMAKIQRFAQVDDPTNWHRKLYIINEIIDDTRNKLNVDKSKAGVYRGC